MNRSTRAGRHARARDGYSIVAVIMSIVLLTVGLMSLAGASAQTVAMQTLAQNRTNAIAIARGHMERIRARDPWTGEAEPAQRGDAEGTPSATGAYTRTVKVSTARQNLLKVDVEVTAPRATTPIVLTTLFFRGNGLTGAP